MFKRRNEARTRRTAEEAASATPASYLEIPLRMNPLLQPLRVSGYPRTGLIVQDHTAFEEEVASIHTEREPVGSNRQFHRGSEKTCSPRAYRLSAQISLAPRSFKPSASCKKRRPENATWHFHSSLSTLDTHACAARSLSARSLPPHAQVGSLRVYKGRRSAYLPCALQR